MLQTNKIKNGIKKIDSTSNLKKNKNYYIIGLIVSILLVWIIYLIFFKSKTNKSKEIPQNTIENSEKEIKASNSEIIKEQSNIKKNNLENQNSKEDKIQELKECITKIVKRFQNLEFISDDKALKEVKSISQLIKYSNNEHNLFIEKIREINEYFRNNYEKASFQNSNNIDDNKDIMISLQNNSIFLHTTGNDNICRIELAEGKEGGIYNIYFRDACISDKLLKNGNEVFQINDGSLCYEKNINQKISKITSKDIKDFFEKLNKHMNIGLETVITNLNAKEIYLS